MRDKRLADAATAASPLLALMIVPVAHADPQAATRDEAPEQVVITGTRVENRSALDSAVPVDVITSEALENVGVTEVQQALSEALPSYNFARPGLADGTDTVRPAALRGLSPDQTLVLVNGKRRHNAALVNVNATIGRGASATDLNTIPAALVRSVEVLRDGASAQYGSDAIAGVINLRLREDREGGGVTATYGLYDTTYDVPVGPAMTLTTPSVLIPNAPWATSSELSRNRSDGNATTISAWKGLPLGASGFLTAAAEYKDQARTERGGYDMRQQYPRLPNGDFDPREVTFNRFNSWYGEPDLNQKTVFLNAGYDLAGGAQIYGWASYQKREVRSAGFYRPAADARNTPQIYPDGFLPIIAPDVDDYSAAAGVKWTVGDWELDTSLVYGMNEMDFTIENTLNRSQGTASKTEFDSGGFDYDQIVLNVSGVRGLDVGLAEPLNIAVGLEARRESYSIRAGEPDSYLNGGLLVNNAPTASGAQVFPGFRPANVVDEDRTAVGAYIDLETRLTEKFLASVALRAEDYSDFGSNVSGKIAGRYDFTEAFALRGSVQNGFRAPSLQQQFFATTSTNFIGGIPFDVTTFPVTDPVAQALGATDLDAEEAISFSLGTVLRFGNLDVTIDAYLVDIDDRIVLSENLTQANVRTFLQNAGFIGAGGGRFFLNGVDTRTKGIDLALTYPFELGAGGTLGLTFAGNYNETEVTRVPQTPQLASLTPAPPVFDRLNVLTFEEGTPDSKLALSANWTLNQFGATLRATRYGDALSPDTATGATFAGVAAGLVPNDIVLGAKTLVDLEARYTFAERFKVAIGAENIFDEYPDPNTPALNTTGTQSFSNYSPFGRSGRFIYSRVSLDF
jgi:iron complex outermembrane recepter protein